jgi:hypothetical protein
VVTENKARLSHGLIKYQAKTTHVGVKVRLHDLLTPALDKLERLDVSNGCVATEVSVPCTLTQEGGLSSQEVWASWRTAEFLPCQQANPDFSLVQHVVKSLA